QRRPQHGRGCRIGTAQPLSATQALRAWEARARPRVRRGRFGRDLLDAGALSYVGVDASANMAALADQTLPGCVRHERIEEFTAPPGSMELVVSRLALHYVSDVGAVLRRVYTTLADSGRLVFSVEHPVITSSDQAWQGRGPPG